MFSIHEKPPKTYLLLSFVSLEQFLCLWFLSKQGRWACSSFQLDICEHSLGIAWWSESGLEKDLLYMAVNINGNLKIKALKWELWNMSKAVGIGHMFKGSGNWKYLQLKTFLAPPVELLLQSFKLIWAKERFPNFHSKHLQWGWSSSIHHHLPLQVDAAMVPIEEFSTSFELLVRC